MKLRPIFKTAPQPLPFFKMRSLLLITSLCFASSLVFIGPVHAQGIAAGTDISNKVVVNYLLNGKNQTPIESSPTGNATPGIGSGQNTIFKVDRKIDLLLTSNNNTPVIPGDSQSELNFSLLNEGNDTQEFSLLANPILGADDFDSDNCTSTVTSVTGTPFAGVTVPTNGNIILKADQLASIKVNCDIPLTSGGTNLQNGDEAILSLTATSEKNSDGSNTIENNAADIANVVETVFADSIGSDDLDHDAKHSARASYLVSNTATLPVLSIDKSIVSITDSTGGNSAISGSEVTYKIHISSTGSGVINDVIITDPTPANMNYKVASIKLDNSNQSDANDGIDNSDFGITNTDTATIDLGNVIAGNQHEILITYIIN